MNKIFIALAIAMVAAFASIGQAQAQVQTGLAFANNAAGNTHKFSGTFNVTIDQSGTNFSIVSITPNGSNTNKVNQVSAEFFDGSYTADVNVAPTTVAGGTNSPAYNSWGAGSVGGNGILGWSTALPGDLGGTSGNTFASASGGSFTYAVGPATPGFLTIQLTSSNSIYAGDDYSARFPITVSVTPEATSVALFLAGLLPLALVMWRRSANKLS